MNLIIAFFLVFIYFSYAEIFDHSCRSLEEYGGAMVDFKPERYLGKWFEIER